MQCPSCDAIAKEMKFGEFNVLACKPCDGFWVSRNNAEPLLDYLLTVKQSGKKFKYAEPEEMSMLNSMFGRYCPICNANTQAYVWGDSGAQSFECVKGCGVWVRMKQLGDIVEWWEINKSSTPRVKLFDVREEKQSFISRDSNIVAGFFGWMSDDRLVLTTPWVTYSLILLNIAFFVISFMIPSYKFMQLLFVPANFFARPIDQLYTVFTSMFLHADLGHIFGNMFFLFIFGKSLEDRLGKWKYLLLYLTSGFVADVFGHAVFTSDPLIPTLGASGAISGILGGYLCSFPKAKISIHKLIFWIPMKFIVPAWVFLGIWFLGQQLLGVATGGGNVAWYAHLMGFVFGFLILLIVKIFNKQ